MEQDNQFNILPTETLLHIFSFFNKRDQGRTSLISKVFHELSEDPSLKDLPYPDLNYSKFFPEKNKSLTTNSAANYHAGTQSIAVLSNQHFIEATKDGYLKVWDKNQLAPIKTFNKHAQYRFKVIYKVIPISATKFISCGCHGAVYLWDINQNTGKNGNWDNPLITFEGHSKNDTIYEIVFLKENNLLMTGCSDRTLRIWNIETGECLYILKEHKLDVGFINIFANNLIASASNSFSAVNDSACDCDIRLWCFEPGTQPKSLEKLKGHNGRITAFCKLNDKLLATGSEGGILQIWNIEKERRIKIINLPNKSHEPQCLKVISSRYLACGTLGENFTEPYIHLYDINSNFALVNSLAGHKLSISNANSIVDLANGYFASADGTYIKLWHVEQKECLQTLEVEDSENIKELVKLPNGYVISSDFHKDGLNIWAFPEREFESISTPKP